MPERVYLDHAATTPLDPRVLEAMLPYLTSVWGNASSSYAEGQAARAALGRARRELASLLGCHSAEIVFTGSGSEADSLALFGIARASGRGAIVISQIEHHAVLHAAQALEREGYRVTALPVTSEGFVDPAALAAAVTTETRLVSIMTANNEVGTIQPIAELSHIVKSRNPRAVFHTDAVQAAGQLPLDVEQLNVDALSLAAHKFYGPKGAGALYVRRGTPLRPMILGGAQEQDRRAGTENVAGAIGMAAALRLATEEMDARAVHSCKLRDRLLDEIPRRIPGALATGPRERARRLPGNASFCLEGIDAELLLMALDMNGFAASSGSACTTGSLEPSHVLTAMGISPSLARGSLRLTSGKDTTAAQVERLLDFLPGQTQRLRALDVPTRTSA